MFIHPLSDSKTTVSNLSDECVQPNAVDLKIAKLFEQVPYGGPVTPSILKDKTVHGTYKEQDPVGINEKGIDVFGSDGIVAQAFRLKPGTFYQFETEHFVEIGEGEIGWLIHRSSLARNGVFITSGVYDAGFRGNIGGVMFNASNNYVNIEVGARVGQLVLAQSESLGKYEGQYQDKGVVSGK
jgi:deoxycytidine triphosphate deaminase